MSVAFQDRLWRGDADADCRHSVHVCRYRAGLCRQVFVSCARQVFSATFQSAFRFNSYVGLAIAGGLHGQDGLAAQVMLSTLLYALTLLLMGL